MDPETFDRALEKLWTHGGAEVDFAENVSRGHDAWREPYLAQGEHKREQIERMIRYARSNQCRMASVVRHFGDVADGEKPCGICDYCAPATCNAQRFRTATPAEHAALLRVAEELRAVGLLHPGISRQGTTGSAVVTTVRDVTDDLVHGHAVSWGYCTPVTQKGRTGNPMRPLDAVLA